MKNVQELVGIFRFISWLKVIVITGGPCGGKSTFLKMAISLLKKHGIRVIVVPEVARELIAAGFHPADPLWRSSSSFQRLIFEGILRKEAQYLEALQELDEEVSTVFLCDRGLLDGMAYMGKEAFASMLMSYGVTHADVLDRYAGVVNLVTAADGAEKFYVVDDERSETPERARELDRLTSAAWHEHQHVAVIDNSTAFSEKINRALLALNRIINIPIAMEIERKYIVRNFGEGIIPSGTAFFDITQRYLNRPDRPGIECRVRKKVTQGASSYCYTEKTSTEVEGVRGEHEEPIDAARYEELITLYFDKSTEPVTKRRYKIQRGRYMFELDVYRGRLEGLIILEVEFLSKDDMASFVLPEDFDLMDVTADKRYSNRMLAQYGIPS
jgi:CYTH domain-containing protein/predicted ATPase